MSEVTLESQLLEILENEEMPEYIKLAKVEMLISLGVDVNVADECGYTALMMASKEGYRSIVELLIKNGADVNKQSYGLYYNSLRYALDHCHKDIVEFLVENNSDLEQKDKGENTPFLWVARFGSKEDLEYFFDKGADINALNKYGQDALKLAVLSGKIEKVKFLVEKGMDIHKKDKTWECTPLISAAEHGYLDIIEYLLDKGALINDVDKCGETALMHASSRGHFDVVKLLCSKGADINIKNYGYSAVMLASGERHVEIVKFLAKKWANLNYQNDHGETALIRAVKFNNKKMIDLLIALGARMDIKDKNGKTAEECADTEEIKNTIEVAKVKRYLHNMTGGLFR